MRTIPPPVLRSGARQSLFLLTWQQPEAHADTHLIYQRPAEAVVQGGVGGLCISAVLELALGQDIALPPHMKSIHQLQAVARKRGQSENLQSSWAGLETRVCLISAL